ncbi:MAG: Gfo/Idh/MocA family oxidoreductase [Ignavibacteriales bacterium]|nr:Gfo/Idh/MocA family oxidoreductase [Ignavibacteriales bacterium]
MVKNIILILILLISQNVFSKNDAPFKIGIIGLSHSHVHWILGRANVGDFEIVGIVETDTALAKRLMKDYNINKNILYSDIQEMVKKKTPEAVTAFGSIYNHLEVVEKCAPLGIHVMVEKPLAVSFEHAVKMKKLADENNIYLITNYETTWYATNHKAYSIVNDENKIGELRKIIVNDGHKGPKEIGVNKEFLDWLTDPEMNGGGAITDFGCYGANLITWLMKGEKPISVTAITQQIKPEIYPKVDDEATIILEYPKAQGIIQASWNWPFSRKDMEIYGQTGYVISENKFELKTRFVENEKENIIELESRNHPYQDPFEFLIALVRNEITMQPYDLSSLENNIIVMQILDAARKSAKTGKRIYLK